MLVFYDPLHRGHAPTHEFFRGERVPCFEKPERIDYVMEQLRARGDLLCEPDIDSRSVLQRLHTPRYLRFLETAWDRWLAFQPGGQQLQPFPSVWPVRSLRSDVEPANFIAQLGLYSMDNGTPLVQGTWTVAKRAADAAASAATRVAAGVRVAFSCTRPPGHHAGADFMGGYCFLNNAAVAAQTLCDHGVPRVAVLDVDFHHGNGTQSIFYARSDVLFVSLHGDPASEYPFYLGHADERGEGAGLGFNRNYPMPAGTSASVWFDTLEHACSDIDQAGCDALVVSLGLDTYEGDPISHFNLTRADFHRLGVRLARLNRPTVLVLEGGYAAADLGLNAAAVLAGFEAEMGA
ncbi:MAG: histone deacetylase family protein [Burkholderiaceae bacterium]